MSVRIQLRRTKGWRMPPNTVKVDRSTKWGNPWTPKNSHVITSTSSRTMTVAECVEEYRESVETREFGYGEKEIRAELAGKNLACWCRLDQPCHADVLLRLANPQQDKDHD